MVVFYWRLVNDVRNEMVVLLIFFFLSLFLSLSFCLSFVSSPLTFARCLVCVCVCVFLFSLSLSLSLAPNFFRNGKSKL